MLEERLEELVKFFGERELIVAAYLFGSYARGVQTPQSDVDIAVLFSRTPENLLEHHLRLSNDLSDILGKDVDLIILNVAPPLLRYQVIKHGRLIYCRNERERISFESKSMCEYLDFSRAARRYDECLLRKLLS